MERTHAQKPQNEQVIYQDGNLELSVKRLADPSAIELLKRTIYGTNGVRYQHTHQEQKVWELHKPLFFQLALKSAIIGVYCLDERQIWVGHNQVKAFYGRYLAVDDRHKSKGYGRLMKKEAIQYIEKQAAPPFVFYSYIEEKNTRSLAISASEGFRSIAILKTFIFRRYLPQIDPRFCQLDSAQMPVIQSLLEDTYTNHTFRNFAHIGYQNNYFVLRDNNEIVAGIQANPVCWQFQSMPGLAGWAMMHLLPALSITRRFFNPANHAFVVLEGLYVKKGDEGQLYALLESVLAHFGLHSALWQIDTNDPFISLLSNSGAGALSSFQKSIRTHVMMKPVGIDDNQPALGHPQYVSCFDFS